MMYLFPELRLCRSPYILHGLCTQGARPLILSGIRGKEHAMINIKKKEEVITNEDVKAGCGCPMMDFIAKLAAIDFDESGEFEYDSAHTVLLCDLMLKLYNREEYKEAMEIMAVAFLMADMHETSQLISVASSGYTEESGKFFLERFFKYSDLYETYMLGRKIYAAEEDDDGEDDSDM